MPAKKSTATKKTTKAKVPAAPAAAPAVVTPAPAATTPAPAAAPVAKTWRSFEEVIEECIKQAQDQVVSNRGMVASVREARKAHDRELRDAQKNSRRSRKQAVGGAKKPLTGFAKPCRITDELADFLHDVAGNSDVNRGIEMSRTEVTRRLNEYFVKNNLRDSEDKRTILYQKDPQLVALLGGGVPAGQKLTYFNLQSALKDKFVKPAPSTPASGAQQTA